MASIFSTARKIGSSVSSLFGRKTPTTAPASAPVAPKVGTTTTQDEIDLGFQKLRQEIEQGRRAILEDVRQTFNQPLQDYLRGEFVPVTSSNVQAIAYFQNSRQILVLFKNGGCYEYSQCDRAFALEFWQHCETSPGGAVWDYFRVRGKGNRWAWKKPFRYLRAGSHNYQPRYENRARWSAEHAAIPPSGERPESWKRGEGPYPPWF